MTMHEKKLQAKEKEIAKIAKSLDRYEAILVKKTALCNKLDCNWTNEEFRSRIQQLHARHEGAPVVAFGNDDDLMTQKQHAACFDKGLAESYVKDYRRRLQIAEKQYAKLAETVKADNEKNEAFRIEYMRLTEMERKMLAKKAEEEYQKWLAEFKAECLKDGIEIEDASGSLVHGYTPSKKRFFFAINDGWTERSNHCYSLRIAGNTIFTSGEFWTCYNAVKRN